eukprot:scaffold465569_cov18-Prasinocladus_malaysianus.AAC.1
MEYWLDLDCGTCHSRLNMFTWVPAGSISIEIWWLSIKYIYFCNMQALETRVRVCQGGWNSLGWMYLGDAAVNYHANLGAVM